MKAAYCFALLAAALIGCDSPDAPSRSAKTMTVTVAAASSVRFSNEAEVRDFDLSSSFPVNITEADCSWQRVTHAHFSCDNAADITVTDARAFSAGEANQIEIRYLSTVSLSAPIFEH